MTESILGELETLHYLKQAQRTAREHAIDEAAREVIDYSILLLELINVWKNTDNVVPIDEMKEQIISRFFVEEER